MSTILVNSMFVVIITGEYLLIYNMYIILILSTKEVNYMGEENGTIIIDGKIMDLNKMSAEDLKKLQKELKAKEAEIRRKIEDELER